MAAQQPPRNVLAYTTVGMEFTALFLLPTLAGILLDAHLGSSPGFTILFAACGFAMGLWHMLRRVRDLRSPKEPREGADETK
jgi:F0F1-type ATP synthase assembly protein I